MLRGIDPRVLCGHSAASNWSSNSTADPTPGWVPKQMLFGERARRPRLRAARCTWEGMRLGEEHLDSAVARLNFAGHEYIEDDRAEFISQRGADDLALGRLQRLDHLLRSAIARIPTRAELLTQHGLVQHARRKAHPRQHVDRELVCRPLDLLLMGELFLNQIGTSPVEIAIGGEIEPHRPPAHLNILRTEGKVAHLVREHEGRGSGGVDHPIVRVTGGRQPPIPGFERALRAEDLEHALTVPGCWRSPR